MKNSENKWKQNGNIYLWRYAGKPRNMPGWHLTADPKGAKSLLVLLDTMRSSVAQSSHTLVVSALTDSVLAVPNYSRSFASYSPQSWSITYNPSAEHQNEWLFPENETHAHLVLGSRMLEELRVGIQDILEGQGDYSIGYDNEKDVSKKTNLWFWWFLEDNQRKEWG